MPSATCRPAAPTTCLSVHLEDSARMPNVRASDEPELQFHQPDETLTRESVIADRRTSTPEDIASSDEMNRLVEFALAAAKPRDREVFILHTIEGFSVAEICRHYRSQAGVDQCLDYRRPRTLAALATDRQSIQKTNAPEHGHRLISAAVILAVALRRE